MDRVRNAPIAIYNDEAPKTNFQDIVALAERLNPNPSLIPPNGMRGLFVSE